MIYQFFGSFSINQHSLQAAQKLKIKLKKNKNIFRERLVFYSKTTFFPTIPLL